MSAPADSEIKTPTGTRLPALIADESRFDPPRLDGHSDQGGGLTELLRAMKARGASDLLLIPNSRPTILVKGQWLELSSSRLTPREIDDLFNSVLSADRRARLVTVRDLDMGWAVSDLGRFRINLHFQRGAMAAAIRFIPDSIPTFDTLGLPTQVLNFANFTNGLVLVTGGTGQGKSTTLAALMEHMHRGTPRHIITIEDPVEFAFPEGTCLIEQREVGDDTPSFASALRHVLRQRPDVILIGELRDLETMASALTAAETGHLVLATLHTCNASQTIARMIDIFPAAQQAQVRTQLAASLRAILCQSLLRDEINETLIPATEVMIATSAVRRAIRDNETHLIHSMIETGRRLGMHTLEQSLESLVRGGRITPQAAVAAATDAARMQTLLDRTVGANSPAPRTEKESSMVMNAADAPKAPWAED